WSASAGAVRYHLERQANGVVESLYDGPGNTFVASLPGGLAPGDYFTNTVYAYSSANAPSGPRQTATKYEVPDTGNAANKILLFVGAQQALGPLHGIELRGPTNLVLRASVTADDAAGATVYFCDTYNGVSTIIGTANGPEAQ